MIRCSIFLWGFLSALSGIIAQTSSHSSHHLIDASIEATMERMHIPGLVIAVSKEGKTIYSKGFGKSDVKNNIDVSPMTRFRMASVSKLITVTAVAKLMQDGKIDIDLPIENYLPDYPHAGEGVTTRLLLSHQAGIRHYEYKDFSKARPYTSTTDALSIFIDDPLIHAPGSGYKYSTYAFTLIQAVIEAASGKSFIEYLDDDVLSPLNMEHTSADTQSPDGQLISKLYRFDGNMNNESGWDDSSYKFGGGGMLSTAEDMLLLGNAYLSNHFLKSKTIESLYTPQVEMPGALPTTHIGLTWRISEDEAGNTYYHHAGSMNGARSFLMVSPEEELVVSVMSNNGQLRNIDVFARAIANNLLEKGKSDEKQQYTFSSDHHDYTASVSIETTQPTTTMQIKVDTIIDQSLQMEVASINVKDGKTFYNLHSTPEMLYYKMEIDTDPYLMVYIKNSEDEWEKVEFEKMRSL
jgi:CubicO group peptidase (beta-lactamase class C family)